jgi:6-phosphogluconolactonase
MLCDRSPQETAVEYEALLHVFFAAGRPRFDLVLLGLGENGHTASLFPGTSVLEEQQRWVSEVFVAEEGLHRLTLTAEAINQAALVVFLVSGSDKALILRKVLDEVHGPHNLPAQLIKPADGRLLWLVDREAASLLQQRKDDYP